MKINLQFSKNKSLEHPKKERKLFQDIPKWNGTGVAHIHTLMHPNSKSQTTRSAHAYCTHFQVNQGIIRLVNKSNKCRDYYWWINISATMISGQQHDKKYLKVLVNYISNIGKMLKFKREYKRIS